MSELESQIEAEAIKVLKNNQRKNWTVPAQDLYPHQWLWDSCFIAIGLRHLDIDRAKSEVENLFSGQWANGMVPHMIFAGGDEHRRDREIWRSWLSPNSPDHIFTSGITQPPMLAEAVIKIGEKLPLLERRTWYAGIYPKLLAYHQWLYKERDPHGDGLVICLHPWEVGLDNTPPWIRSLRNDSMPWWIRLTEKLGLEAAINLFRRDTKFIPPGQRISAIEALAYMAALRNLRRKRFDSQKILPKAQFSIEDLTFNSILIRANSHLKKIAKTVGQGLPDDLISRMTKAEQALDSLWDEQTGQYFSRQFITHQLIDEPSIAMFMPLYAGTISKDRAGRIVELLNNKRRYNLPYPVPSVPLDSEYFDPLKYWQGPTWLNTNWLIADGLARFGYNDEAERIKQASLGLVNKSGFYEYFHPISGDPAGANNFSWTAALAIDFARQK